MTSLAEKFPAAVRATAPQHLGRWNRPLEINPPEMVGGGPAVTGQGLQGSYWWDQMETNCLGTLAIPATGYSVISLGDTWTFPKSAQCKAQHFVNSPPTPTPIVTFVIQLMVELGRLDDGWDGPGSAAPRDEVTLSLLAVTQALPANAVEPEAEIDGSDGSIALRWFSADNSSTLSIRMAADSIVCTYSQINGGPRGAVFTKEQVTPMARFLADFDQMLKNA